VSYFGVALASQELLKFSQQSEMVIRMQGGPGKKAVFGERGIQLSLDGESGEFEGRL